MRSGSTIHKSPDTDDAGRLAWRVGPDITEVEIERDQHPITRLCGMSNGGIVSAGESLVPDRLRVSSILNFKR